MPMIRQNRLIPILGIVVLTVVVVILFKSRSPLPSHLPMAGVPRPPTKSPDADSPADTIRTLTAEVKGMRDENRGLREDNSKLLQNNDDLARNRAAIEENVTRRLTEQFARPEASSSPVFSGLNRKIDDLAASMQRMVPGPAVPAPAEGHGIPPGLGFDSSGAPVRLPPGTGQALPGAGPSAAANMVWWEPLGSKTVVGPDGQPKVIRATYPAIQPPLPAAPMPGSPEAATTQNPDPTPKRNAFFTIPENATLMDATAMTALIGRTPVGGNVRDPMEFKALIGRNNLAANGFEVPDDVSGMVVAGTAVGDWMLSCVEGHVNSVTFIFQDGSISTVSRRNAGGTNGHSNAMRLGYLSDERGAPCINGDRITNAPTYLTQIVGMKSLEVAARAAALSQTTTVTNGIGSSTSVTGSPGQFVLGQAAAAGVDEVSNWLMRRLTDSFDAIYVRPGAKVAVHLTEAIALDKDPNARRLDHGQANRSSTASRTALTQLD